MLEAPKQPRVNFLHALSERVDNDPLIQTGTRVTLGWSILLSVMLPFAIHADFLNLLDLVDLRMLLPKLGSETGNMQRVALVLSPFMLSVQPCSLCSL